MEYEPQSRCTCLKLRVIKLVRPGFQCCTPSLMGSFQTLVQRKVSLSGLCNYTAVTVNLLVPHANSVWCVSHASKNESHFPFRARRPVYSAYLVSCLSSTSRSATFFAVELCVSQNLWIRNYLAEFGIIAPQLSYLTQQAHLFTLHYKSFKSIISPYL